ncbi:MAG: T9SS type A sorting domain-containing protein, partial [bacterium]
LSFQIPVAGRVNLKVFDVLGREVATLLNEEKAAGSFSVRWNAATASTGTYFARLESNGKTRMMKMMLVK